MEKKQERRGISANDTPETDHKVPEDLKKLPKFGKSCRVQSSQVNATAVHGGPTADGVLQTDFKPCSERKRASKTKKNKPSKARNGKPASTNLERVKRSESYAAINWLWADPENIPLVFDKSFPAEYKPTVQKAIEMWENYTCIRFVETTPPPSSNISYVLLTTGGGTCTTDRLGPNWYSPFTTRIDASLCANSTGSLSHEFGHTIGLAHSQKRIDRDRFVNFFTDNVAAAWRPQFEKDDYKYFTDWGVPFYYDSIMTYFPYAATINNLMTLCPLDPLMEIIMGQREEPSFGDLSLVNKMYCQESCFNRSDLNKPYFGALSMTISGRTCQNWAMQSPHQHKFSFVGNHSYCRNPDGWNGGPWCYTNEPTILYEPCFSACEDLAAANKPFCEGWCHFGGYHNPDNCSCHCPPQTTGKFCEVLDDNKKYNHLACGGRIIMNVGQTYSLNTPNYPKNHSSNLICMWWLSAPINKTIRLTINDFYLEIPDNTGCYDYLEIRRSVCATAYENPEKMRYCGDSLAPDPAGTLHELSSDDSNLILKFVADENNEARGFKLTADILTL